MHYQFQVIYFQIKKITINNKTQRQFTERLDRVHEIQSYFYPQMMEINSNQETDLLNLEKSNQQNEKIK